MMKRKRKSGEADDTAAPIVTTTFKKRKLTLAQREQQTRKKSTSSPSTSANAKRKPMKVKKSKDTITHVDDMSQILSDELRAELGEDAIATMGGASSAKGKGGKKMKLRPGERKLSKSEQKRLAQLQRQKRAKVEAKDLYRQLQKTKLDDEKLQLMRSSSNLGKKFKESGQEQLDRALREQRAGVPLTVDVVKVSKFMSRKKKQKERDEEAVGEWSEAHEKQLYYRGNADDESDDLSTTSSSSSIADAPIPDAPISAGESSDEAMDNVEHESPENDANGMTAQETKKPFMVLDFGFSGKKPNEPETEQSSVSIDNAMEDDIEQKEHGYNNNINNENNDDNESPVSDDVEDDDEPRTWREKVCKGFDELIDMIDTSLPQDNSHRDLIMSKIGELFDTVLPDPSEDGSDNDIDEDEDTAVSSEARNTSSKDDDDTTAVVNLNKIMSTSKTEAPKLLHEEEQDMKLIQQMIEERKVRQEAKRKSYKYFVPVNRKDEIERQRQMLPVYAEEQNIMEHIQYNDVIILCGETGSGKTTQIPQFLFEAGYGEQHVAGNASEVSEEGVNGMRPMGMIGVTQPRRVAAISTAKRVSEELNVEYGREVAYQVRYDNNIQDFDALRIKFMTDGILLREIQDDPLLMKYSAIILDEAHERNVNTDILIGWLSRFLPQRNRMARSLDTAQNTLPDGRRITPLKLIIMSATLRVDDFVKNERLFTNRAPISDRSSAKDNDSDGDDDGNTITNLKAAEELSLVANKPPPVININARQYPVSTHFNRRTVFDDYVKSAEKKIMRIHEKLPEGNVLVFLTGKQEIDYLVNKLTSYADNLQGKFTQQQQQQEQEGKTDAEDMNDGGEEVDEEDFINDMEDLSDSDTEQNDDGDEAMDEQQKYPRLPRKVNRKLPPSAIHNKPPLLHVLPLYSMLQPQQQLKVFEPPPTKQHRLVIVATNVAETSLTIPGVRYVVDAGRVKDKQYDKDGGISKFVVQWTSKASADQRAGRAGRTGPGHCYRLYSAAVFDQYFPQFTEPDILKTPIESVALQMKSMGIKQIPNFPFPSPPDSKRLNAAVRMLQHIGALSSTSMSNDDSDGTITSLGKQMSQYPVNPRLAKMVIAASDHSNDVAILNYVLAMVSAMTVGQIFMHDQHLSSLRFKEFKGKHLANDDSDDEANANADDFEDDSMSGNEASTVQQKKYELSEKDRKLKEHCLKCKRQWAHAESDILSMLKAIGAFEYALAKGGTRAANTFCRDNMLHSKNMHEVHKLRLQLHNMVQQVRQKLDSFQRQDGATDTVNDLDDQEIQAVAEEEDGDLPTLPPPSHDQEIILRQILCSGYVDQVARLATTQELEKLKLPFYKENKNHANRPYVALGTGMQNAVYIHMHSFTFFAQKDQTLVNWPSYVTYTELSVSTSRTRKMYMKGVTKIQPEWITSFASGSLVKFSKPLDVPAPRYDSDNDRITCFVTPTVVGTNDQQGWTLPPREIPYLLNSASDADMLLRLFGKLLLEGKIFEELGRYKLKSDSKEILQKNSESKKSTQFLETLSQLLPDKMQKIFWRRTSSRKLFKALKKACTKKTLSSQWKRDKGFLKMEWMLWTREEPVNWPPSEKR